MRYWIAPMPLTRYISWTRRTELVREHPQWILDPSMALLQNTPLVEPLLVLRCATICQITLPPSFSGSFSKPVGLTAASALYDSAARIKPIKPFQGGTWSSPIKNNSLRICLRLPECSASTKVTCLTGRLRFQDPDCLPRSGIFRAPLVIKLRRCSDFSAGTNL